MYDLVDIEYDMCIAQKRNRKTIFHHEQTITQGWDLKATERAGNESVGFMPYHIY